MRAGLVVLTLGYVLSQFFRSFLAVLAEDLRIDIGVGPEDLAFASGLWFLAFALMQIPVGWALDKIGPKATAAALFGVGAGGGALIFALATSALHVNIAMVLIGIGCAPVLMASYYIFARVYPPARFATLAAMVIGIGSLGNLAGASPLTWMVGVFGWRATMAALAAVSLACAFGIWALVRNPDAVSGDARGSLLDLLKMRALWFILPAVFVLYAPVAGIRGSWIGPYLLHNGFDETQVGFATLLMALAMILGTFFYGPLDRIFGTRKWVVLAGGTAVMVALFVLIGAPVHFHALLTLFCLIGFFGMTYPVIMAHGRAFFPPHLAGRGVTLLNMFSIGGAGFLQMVSGRIYVASAPSGIDSAYFNVFTFFALVSLIGLLPYIFAQDRTD